MALVLKDRVYETSTTSGTGTLTLAGAVDNFQTFSSAIGNGNTTYYTIADDSAKQWEVGIGTVGAGTLSRDTVYASSNGGSLVNFSANAKQVFCDYPASKSVYTDASGNISNLAGSISKPTFIEFDQTYATALSAGQLGWDGNNTLALGMAGGNVVQHIGEDSFFYIKASSAITKGQLVMFTGAVGASGVLTGAPSTGVTIGSYIMGVAAEDIANNGFGLVQCFGELTGVNTNGFNEGDVLYYDSAVTGGLTSTFPTSGPIVTVAAVAKKSAGGGVIYIRVSVTQRITAGTGTTVTQTNTGTSIAVTNPYNPASVAITGGTINGTTIGATTPATGKFTTLESTGTGSFGTTNAQYIQAVGSATEPQILAAGSGTNIPLVLQPKGTGAIQAQATTSTTAGGNARGANAVDWQTSRGAASQVASGQLSVIGGGINNVASQYNSSIVCGFGNSSTGIANFIGSGSSNTGSGSYSAIVGGVSNTSAGLYNFIGGGFTNSGTANAAVTTQSGTMNGTTAVTLSGSNANIKVGQYITGTSIAADTYVAAISGISLTLSKNASGSSTSTLSFFTPHGVVVGGGNNQATGSYSFIGGGGDAGTAGNRNVASGDWSVVGGGTKNTASGLGSFIGGGGTFGSGTAANTASGIGSSIVGCWGNNATGTGAFVLGGSYSTASGSYSSIVSGVLGTTRNIVGYTTFSASNNPMNTGTLGSQQGGLLVLARQTTDATATVLTSDANAATTTNQVILPNNSAYYIKGFVVAGVTGAGNSKGWEVSCLIKRGANAASTSIVGAATVTAVYMDAGASTWLITLTADTTNGGLAVTVTGQAATTIRWVAKLETTEMTY